MAGKIHELIDKIIAERAKGNPTLITTTKTKFIFKGINPSSYDSNSPDDPAVIEKIMGIAKELNVKL